MKKILTTSLVICVGVIIAATMILIPATIFAYAVFFLPMLK